MKGTEPLFSQKEYQPPEKLGREPHLRKAAMIVDGFHVCNICNCKQGLPQRITGVIVELTEVTSRGNKLWLCQECVKFAHSIHEQRRKEKSDVQEIESK